MLSVGEGTFSLVLYPRTLRQGWHGRVGWQRRDGTKKPTRVRSTTSPVYSVTNYKVLRNSAASGLRDQRQAGQIRFGRPSRLAGPEEGSRTARGAPAVAHKLKPRTARSLGGRTISEEQWWSVRSRFLAAVGARGTHTPKGWGGRARTQKIVSTDESVTVGRDPKLTHELRS